MHNKTRISKRLMTIILSILLAAAMLPAIELNQVQADILLNGVSVLWEPPSGYFSYSVLHTEADADSNFRSNAKSATAGEKIDSTNSHFMYLSDETEGGWTGISGSSDYLTTRKQYALQFRVTLDSGYDWSPGVKNLQAYKIVSASSIGFGVRYNYKVIDNADISYNPYWNEINVYVPIDGPDTFDITEASFSGIEKYYEYTGSKITPAPEIWINERKLKKGTDYILTYLDNKNPGIASLYISGKDDFVGIFLKTFRITFIDVPYTHSYFKAVNFVSDNQIAAGYTGSRRGYFGVSDDVTRGQVVTMLWRAAGKPNPSGTGQVFKDVPTTHKFYKAIQWAYEQDIAAGYTGSRKGYFGVNDSCTRGQIVTFLWRAAGRPNPKNTGVQTFSDVPLTHSFYKSIQWAVDYHIAAGYSNGKFKPNDTCTRGHCAKFLYKYYS